MTAISLRAHPVYLIPQMDAAKYNSIVEQLRQMTDTGLKVLAYAERVLPFEEYGINYEFDDGRRTGYASCNFPVGEFRQETKSTKCVSCRIQARYCLF
jgi:hypothetical protein